MTPGGGAKPAPSRARRSIQPLGARRWNTWGVGPEAESTPGDLGARVLDDVPARRLWAGELVVEHSDDTLSISAMVRWDGPHHGPVVVGNRRLGIEIHDLDRLGCDRRHLLAAHTPPHATALVPMLAVLAAASGADLSIDAPVCPVALAGARRAVALGQRTHGWPAVTLGASAGATSAGRRGGHGFVFSLDLDNLAALLAQRHDGSAPTHLIALDDLEGCGESTLGRWRTQAVAANEARLPLVRASTNARTFTDPIMNWSAARGAVVASSALALSGIVTSVGIPSLDLEPGTGALWSSATVDLEECAPVGTRTTRAADVASDPWAARWLRVCPSGGGGANCGTCRACQLALSHLWLADAAGEAFRHPVDPAVVRTLEPLPLADPTDYTALVNELLLAADGMLSSGVAPNDRLLAIALADAWTVHLARCGVDVGVPALSA